MSDKRRLISVHLGRSDSYPSVRLCLFPRGMSPCDVFTGFLPVASRVFPFGLRLSSYSDFQNFFGSTDLLSQASVCSIWIRAYPGPIPRVQPASAPAVVYVDCHACVFSPPLLPLVGYVDCHVSAPRPSSVRLEAFMAGGVECPLGENFHDSSLPPSARWASMLAECLILHQRTAAKACLVTRFSVTSGYF